MPKQPDSWHRHVIDNMLPRMEASAVTTPAITGLTPGPADGMPVNIGFSALQPGFDVIELLPPGAAEKLRLLRQRRADAHALTVEFEQVRQASSARIEAQNALKRFTDHPQDGGFNLPDDDHSVVTARRTLEKATNDLERLKQLQEVRAAAFYSASGALSAVETWAKDGRPHGTMLEDYEGPEPKLLKGEAGLLDAIENRRRRVRELRADLHRLASAPFPSAYCKQRMREQIEALAMQGAPSVSALIELDGKVEFQTQRLTSEVHAERRSLAFTAVEAAIPTLAWLHKDALIAALDREINTESDDPASLSHEARQKAEAEVMGDLLAVERDESALVYKAWTDGLSCEHRSDCSPLALLGLRLVTAPRAAPPPTSPGHAWDVVQPGRRR